MTVYALFIISGLFDSHGLVDVLDILR